MADPHIRAFLRLRASQPGHVAKGGSLFFSTVLCPKSKACPVLDVLEAGAWEPKIAPGADLRTDLPRYRIYEKGEFKEEAFEVGNFFQDDLVSFLFGCSFSFESALLSAGVPVRNLE